MLRSKWFVRALLPLAMLGLILACSDDDKDNGGGGPGNGTTTIIVPSAWGGTWFIESTQSTDRGQPIEVQALVICPGENAIDAFNFFEGGAPMDVTCTGSMGSATSDFTCTATFAVNDTCTATSTVHFMASGPGTSDEITGTVTFTDVYSGQCEGAENDTTESTFIATRFDGDLPGCGVFEDTMPTSWGGHWDVIFTEVDCEADTAIAEPDTTLDELFCPGVPAAEFFPFEFRQAIPQVRQPEGAFYNGGFTETSADFFIAVAAVNEFGCDTAMTARFEVTRDGDSFTGTITVLYRVLGGEAPECEPYTECLKARVEGRRVDIDTSECVP